MALAGLLQDAQAGSRIRVPFIGDIPFIGNLFGNRVIDREETELIILVSPELVHPMDPEEAPLILPGMEVTEPNDWDFFFYGRYEGRPDCHHRSTVWPIQKERIFDAHIQALHDAKSQVGYQESSDYYMYGTHGFTN